MADTKTSEGFLISKKYAYGVFVLLFLLYMFDYIDRTVVTSLFPFLKEDWGISDAQCGMLVSAVYVSVLIFTFPISILIDRWSRKKSIALMGILWSVATAVCAVTQNFAQLIVARSAIGIGEAGYAPGGTAMISALFPEKKRAQVMGIWNASIPLGIALGMVLGGFIAEHFGWRSAFGIVAIPGFIIAIMFFFIRDYKTVELVQTQKEGQQQAIQEKMGFKEIVEQFVKTPSLLLTYFAFAGNTFVTTALLSWLPVYFHRMDNLPMDQAGLKGGAVMSLALIGAPLGGYLADRWRRKQINARLYFAAFSSFMTAVMLFLAFSMFQGWVEYGFLLTAGLAVAAFIPAGAAVTQDVIHVGLRAISYSLCVIVQHVLGSVIGPIFVGYLSDDYGLDTALTFLPIFNVVAGILFILASLYYKKDLDKVAKVEIETE